MITPATRSDIPDLVQLINSAYRGESSKQGWTTEAHLIGGLRTDAEELGKIMEKPDSVLLKCTDETGTLIGCVRLKKQGEKMYLGMLTVLPALQARGTGKQLLQAAEDHARREGCRAIYMTVISVRTELIAWYERHGYRFTGETQPFEPNEKFEILQQPLDFMVLEKEIYTSMQ
jgi:ribosomal protein S18 acetylase RimI-like enzyme